MDILIQRLFASLRKAELQLKCLATELKGVEQSIQENTKAVEKQTRTQEDSQYSQRRVLAELKIPQSEKYKKETQSTRDTLIKWFTLYAEGIGIIIVIAYTTVAAFQLREMRRATAATETSAKAAESSANTAAKEELITEESLRAMVETKICKLDSIRLGEHITAHCDFINAGHSKAYSVKSGSDNKRWKYLPAGPMPVQLAESGDLAPEQETTIYFRDYTLATVDFLNGLPELTTNDEPRNETLFFFSRFEYVTLGRIHHTEICFHLTKSAEAPSQLMGNQPGYILRRCKKWYSSD